MNSKARNGRDSGTQVPESFSAGNVVLELVTTTGIILKMYRSERLISVRSRGSSDAYVRMSITEPVVLPHGLDSLLEEGVVTARRNPEQVKFIHLQYRYQKVYIIC